MPNQPPHPHFLLETLTTETATGTVAELFKRFPPQVGVPAPLYLFSASPELLEAQGSVFRYLARQPRLSFELLAAIRYLASRELGAPDCREFNRKLLVLSGLTEAEIDALPQSGGAYSAAEQALLAYCVQLISQPTTVTEEIVNGLRGHGWTDVDIMDASMQTANMQIPALLLQALKR